MRNSLSPMPTFYGDPASCPIWTAVAESASDGATALLSNPPADNSAKSSFAYVPSRVPALLIQLSASRAASAALFQVPGLRSPAGTFFARR